MKIVFIITGLSTGGAEMMLLKILENIDRSRFDPHVISLSTQGEIGSRIEALGIPVEALGMRAGLPSFSKFLRLFFHLRRLKPNVVHTWMYHADLLGGLATKMAGIQAVVWGLRHSNLSSDKNKRSTLLVMKLCAKLSAWLPQRILSCSERARAIHIEAGYCKGKIEVIPNGFDLSRFVPNAVARASVRTELKLSPDVQLVGLIARDDPQKNHLGFVTAAAIVHQVLPHSHFILAGSGVDKDNSVLVKAIANAGLLDRFHLLGRRDDIPRLMASLDVLASSSWGEAFPNVLGEAMACSVPCVVTDVGDSAEIVGDTGRVVMPGDMTGLARHIVELLQLPVEQHLRLGLSAREQVSTHYEISNITRQYQEFYMRLLRDS